MKLVQKLLPPEKWRFPVLILMAVMVGLSAFIFKISKAHSYLSDDPKTCVNCHIMAPQYATWNHSSHGEKATCSDCHVPHNNAINKYYFKAKDGMRHASMFALRLEPQVIKIHEAGHNVVQNNCIRCHEHLLTDDKMNQKDEMYTAHRTDCTCWECHREVPHGRVNSLSSVPNARVPVPSSPVPEWLKDLLSE